MEKVNKKRKKYTFYKKINKKFFDLFNNSRTYLDGRCGQGRIYCGSNAFGEGRGCGNSFGYGRNNGIEFDIGTGEENCVSYINRHIMKVSYRWGLTSDIDIDCHINGICQPSWSHENE